MPELTPSDQRRLDTALKAIAGAVYTIVAPLKIKAWRTREPVPFEQRRSGEALQLSIGDAWGQLFDCAWFRFTGTVPAEAAGQPVVLLLDVNGEMCVVNEQGVPLRGLTNVASQFDLRLGMPGKRVLPLYHPAQGGESIEVWADAGANDLFGFLQENGQVKEAWVATCHEETRALYYDFEVLLDSLQVLPAASPRFQQILVALNDATYVIWNGLSSETVQQARQVLAPALAQQGGDPSLQISAVGHAHMDLAWLWPLRETRRKGARTFATALANMQRYPDYIFAASQAQLFQWMKEDYPVLYEKIAQQVRAGRIEPQGALWVESDTNLTSGESLVRQILYGQRFFQQEFGITPRYVWLPDTFGYSAALPQIIKLAGMDYFSTQKLSWSLINHFPYHSFHWQGIDGSSVLVHMLPEETYNSPAAPRSIGKIESNYAERGVSDQALLVFGIGDGGGGPGEEHLERLARLKNFAGLSPVKQRWAAEFFSRLAKDEQRFPTWVGELYLERHQGTLTTNARSKRYNRKMEQALRELEWTASLAHCLTGIAYPAQQLETIWKEVLLYQFHDILPGSSIKRVYDESLARYSVLHQQVEEMLVQYQTALAGQISTAGMQQPVLVFNALSWERQSWLKLGEVWQQVRVPAMGCRSTDQSERTPVFPTPSAAPDQIENERLLVRFDASGAITSLFDKQQQREAIPAGETANQLLLFCDYGDAWDIPLDYVASQPARLPLAETRTWVDGPRAIIEQTYRQGASEVLLEISLEAGSSQLEFFAQVKWREPQTMLRAIFPVNVFAEQATFEIQYGHVQRPTHQNTTWDLAKDEVAAQKWVDLSQRDFGVALLNDSKYGHRIKGHTIELNLLRSVPYPGSPVDQNVVVQPGEPHPAFTDQAEHAFRYALLPHPGDFVTGSVIQAAYEFNLPLRVLPVQPGERGKQTQTSWLEVSPPNVILETVKWAEDGSGMVLRLYEAARSSTQAALRINLPVQEVWQTDLLEGSPQPLDFQDGQVLLSFRPFEIKTLLLR